MRALLAMLVGALGAATTAVPRPIALADLARLAEIGGATGQGLSVSPDGKWVAFEEHSADADHDLYRVSWVVVDTSARGRAPIRLDGGDATLFRRVEVSGYTSGAWMSESPVWSADSQWIFYRKRQDGQTQISRSHATDGRTEALTRNAADVESFRLSLDGSRIFYETDAPRLDRLAVASERARSGCRVADDIDWAWSPRQAQYLIPKFQLTDGRPSAWVFELDGAIDRPATATEVEADRTARQQAASAIQASVDARLVVSSRDGSRWAWLNPRDPHRRGIQPPLTLSFANQSDIRSSRRCLDPACQGMIEDGAADLPTLRGAMWWSSDSQDVYFVRREGANFGVRTLYAWNVTTDRVRQILQTDHWVSDCQPFATRAICFEQSAARPRRVIAIDLRNGSLRTIYEPNPEFSRLALGDTRRLEWSDGQGHSTFGYLVKPVGYRPGRPYPLIVIGYRAKRVLRGGTGDEYPAHVLSANGFMVLCYDTPDDWEVSATAKDADEVLRRTWGRGLTDVRVPVNLIATAVDRLARQGLIDPARVGITGFSTGASQAAYALIHGGYFAAAALSNVMWDYSAAALDVVGEKSREGMSDLGFGSLNGADGASWTELALDLNAKRITTPLLINASDFEANPAIGAAQALWRAGKAAELYLYPDEFHVKWHPAHLKRIWERNLDWFRFWLQDYEDPAADKIEQYARWRKLKDSAAPALQK